MKKTDQQDAHKLAELLRLGALPQAYAPPREVRDLRNLARERIWYTNERTKFSNQILWRMNLLGVSIGHKIRSQKGTRELEQTNEGFLIRGSKVMTAINDSIKQVDKEIHEVFQNNPQAQKLATKPGIGEYSATLIVAEIGDINRFTHSKKLSAYAGLAPTVRQSGENTYIGHTRRRCNTQLKWIMIQCAHRAIQYDPKIREVYQRLAPRIGGKKAVVAVARKMLTHIYWMLKTQQPTVANVSSQ